MACTVMAYMVMGCVVMAYVVVALRLWQADLSSSAMASSTTSSVGLQALLASKKKRIALQDLIELFGDVRCGGMAVPAPRYPLEPPRRELSVGAVAQAYRMPGRMSVRMSI